MSDESPGAFRFPCKECGAKRGAPCTYLPVKGLDPAFVHYRSAKTQARHALVGQPTRRPHNARLSALAKFQAREWERERYRQWVAARDRATPRVNRDQVAAIRAVRAFEHREHEQLWSWLARYASLLTQAETVRTDEE